MTRSAELKKELDTMIVAVNSVLDTYRADRVRRTTRATLGNENQTIIADMTRSSGLTDELSFRVSMFDNALIYRLAQHDVRAGYTLHLPCCVAGLREAKKAAQDAILAGDNPFAIIARQFLNEVAAAYMLAE